MTESIIGESLKLNVRKSSVGLGNNFGSLVPFIFKFLDLF